MPVIYELFINGKLTYCYKTKANCTYQFGRGNQPEKMQQVGAVFFPAIGFRLFIVPAYLLPRFEFLFTIKPIA